MNSARRRFAVQRLRRRRLRRRLDLRVAAPSRSGTVGLASPRPGGPRVPDDHRAGDSVTQQMYLERINEPADLRGMSIDELRRARRRDPRLRRGGRVEEQRSPRLEPRGGRAVAGAAPGVRLPDRRDSLGHRPSGVRPQDRDGPHGAVRVAAPGRRAVRLPEPRGEPPRPHREQPRIDGAELRVRHGRRPATPASTITATSSPSSATGR